MGLESEIFRFSAQGLKAEVKVRPHAFSSRDLMREKSILRLLAEFMCIAV